MKTYADLSDFWHNYFLKTPRISGIDTWAIVFMARDGHDLLFSIADPFTDTSEEVFIRDVSDNDATTFAHHYRQQFIGQLPARFGLFRPEVDSVLTEYPDWSTFYDTWLNDQTTLLQSNMPLLFDFPSDQEYRAMRLKGADYAGYQRLLVVVYQYRKQQFQKIFIKSVDEVQLEHIKRQIDHLFRQALPQLILPAANHHHA